MLRSLSSKLGISHRGCLSPALTSSYLRVTLISVTNITATATLSSLAFWCQPTQVVLENRLLTGVGLTQKIMGWQSYQWTICISFAPHSRQITMPVPHQSVVLQAGCPSCRSTNSVKALKVPLPHHHHNRFSVLFPGPSG